MTTIDSSLAQSWLLWGPEVHGIGMLRTITYMFVHADVAHLCMNMVMLVFIGQEVERFAGSWAMLVIYIFSGLSGALSVVLLTPLDATVGASGALYGLMAVLVYIAYRERESIVGPLVLVGANVVYTLASSGVSLWGHVGGLIGGGIAVGGIALLRAAGWAGIPRGRG